MGLLNFFRSLSLNKFVSEKQFEDNLHNKLKMTPQTLQQLGKGDVSENTQLKLEFFFYTNTADKAEQLACELKALKYEVDFENAVGHKKLFVINGWTTRMKMDEHTVLKWTEDMAKLGYQFDTEFDGWGTNPKQK